MVHLKNLPPLLAVAVCCWLPACDDSARFQVQTAQFQTVQVVSGFPAVVDPAHGTVKRVCGVPLRDDFGALLPGETDAAPNGMELTVNLVAMGENNAARGTKCENDKDFAIKDGERVEFRPVTTNPDQQTVAPGQFKLQLQCYEQRSDAAKCAGGAVQATQPAQVVQYHKDAARCDVADPATWQDVAVIVDASGSMSGFVATDAKTCAESTKIAEDLPGQVVQKDIANCMSDPFRVLVAGAQQLIDGLNDRDRVVALGFSENEQVFAACTDAVACQRDDNGTPKVMPGKCVDDADCAGRFGQGFQCGARPDHADVSVVPNMAPADQLRFCFGSTAQTKAFNKFGIDALVRNAGNGRAAVYEAVQAAYDFLKAQQASHAKHIVLLTDGPDTCTASDNFAFTSIAKAGMVVPKCRKECSFTTVHYAQLVQEMQQDGFAVHVHVIQIQSAGHLEPDARLQELACRTEGTYQFLNTASLTRSNAEPWLNAIGRAVLKVRYALAGSWRVGVVDNSIAQAPKGQLRAVRGSLRFSNSLFASLEPIFQPGNAVDWQFDGSSGGLDARLPFRVACANGADCGGGTGECAVNSCGEDGLCRAAGATDLLPCGAAGKGVCCKGACAAYCAGVCQ